MSYVSRFVCSLGGRVGPKLRGSTTSQDAAQASDVKAVGQRGVIVGGVCREFYTQSELVVGSFVQVAF